MYDSNQNQFGDQGGQFSQPPRRSTSAMGIASISCAIIGLFCIMTGMFAIVFGSLAILFAHLSKGSREKIQRPATYGRLVGCIAAGVGVIMIAASFFIVIRDYGSIENYYYTYMYNLEQTYGIDLDIEEGDIL